MVRSWGFERQFKAMYGLAVRAEKTKEAMDREMADVRHTRSYNAPAAASKGSHKFVKVGDKVYGG